MNLYDVGRQAYLTGNDFWGMKAIRPRRVFIACPLGEYSRTVKKKGSAWHDTLEELRLRIDARPEDRKGLEKESAPERSITKLGGGVLTLVEGESQLPGTWTGLDKKGNQVKWHSVTNMWICFELYENSVETFLSLAAIN